MRVVVFGGSGFLGSFVADALTLEGHEVVIYDLRDSPYLQGNQEMLVGDILDRPKVDAVVKGADLVYNFAGIADLDLSSKEPYRTLHVNTMGNLNILDACAHHRVSRFIFASTLYVYGHSGSFYRSSKQCCELAIEAYAEQLGLGYTILRYGTIYGPRSNEGNSIHQMLWQALTQKKIIRQGDGSEIREYIHIYDAARLSVRILAEDFRNQYVIISGQQPIQIRNLLVMIREIFNNEIDVEFQRIKREGHYEVTPYHFRPKLAKRIVDSSYVDLGQGILELVHTLAAETKECDELAVKLSSS